MRVDEAGDDQLAAVVVHLRAGGQGALERGVVAGPHDLAGADDQQPVFPVLIGIVLAILRVVQEMQHAAAVGVEGGVGRGRQGGHLSSLAVQVWARQWISTAFSHRALSCSGRNDASKLLRASVCASAADRPRALKVASQLVFM